MGQALSVEEVLEEVWLRLERVRDVAEHADRQSVPLFPDDVLEFVRAALAFRRNVGAPAENCETTGFIEPTDAKQPSRSTGEWSDVWSRAALASSTPESVKPPTQADVSVVSEPISEARKAAAVAQWTAPAQAEESTGQPDLIERLNYVAQHLLCGDPLLDATANYPQARSDDRKRAFAHDLVAIIKAPRAPAEARSEQAEGEA